MLLLWPTAASCVVTDPDGFTLGIMAEVMEKYLQPGKQAGEEGKGFLSPLGAIFEKHGLGTPDCAVFWDFCVCAGSCNAACLHYFSFAAA